MPNKPDKSKELIGFRATPDVLDAVDRFGREGGYASRDAALVALITEALIKKGMKLKEIRPIYLPDKKKNARKKPRKDEGTG